MWVVVEIMVEVKKPDSGGLYLAVLSVGTPGQSILAAVDTASSWLWFPEAQGPKPGFEMNASSSASLGEEKRSHPDAGPGGPE
eukprot:s2431_g3.t1